MTNETLTHAQQWFESMGYDAGIDHDSSLYLYLDGFSVQLSNGEIEARAEQYLNEQNRD
jgi:hypothetical protein